MKLKIKKIDFSTGNVKICVLNIHDAEEIGLNVNERVFIVSRNKRVCAFIDIDRKGSLVKHGEVGLFEETFRELGENEGSNVEIIYAGQPDSVKYIIKKMDGYPLSYEEYLTIMKDVVSGELSQVECTAFITACYTKGVSLDESINLTKAIVNSGPRPKFDKKVILDKHCIGGVPGNRTTLIVVPILAALGYTIPKTSSRAITSPAGTADTMEVFCPVDLTISEMEEVVRKTNGCIAWGGGSGIAAADDYLIQIRKPLHLDPLGVMLASILAKKKAVGSTHVLIDIPIGATAKVKSEKEGMELAKKLISVGTGVGMNIKCILTDGSAPIGNAIGPCLEAKQHLELMIGLKKVPFLVNKSILMASKILSFIGVPNSYEKAREVFISGRAYDKFKEIVEAQGGNPNIKPEDIPIGSKTYTVFSEINGRIRMIDNKIISKIAFISGCPKTKEAGIYLHVNVGDRVKKGDKIMTIYSESESKLTKAIEYLKENNPFKIGSFVYGEIDKKIEKLN